MVEMVERSDGGKLAVNLTWLISLVREFGAVDCVEDGLLLCVDVWVESLVVPLMIFSCMHIQGTRPNEA